MKLAHRRKRVKKTLWCGRGLQPKQKRKLCEKRDTINWVKPAATDVQLICVQFGIIQCGSRLISIRMVNPVKNTNRSHFKEDN